MIKLKSKSATLILLIVIAGGSAIVIATQLSSDKPTSTTKTKTTAVDASTNPTEVTRDLAKYNNKTIAVKGTVVQASVNGAKDYYVSGQEEPPSAIKLDFSQTNLSPGEYVETPPSPTSTGTKYVGKRVYTITGKLSPSQAGKPPALVVQSID